MAQNNEPSKSADKGKGKATEKDVDESKKTKDGQVNGKKDENKVGCMRNQKNPSHRSYSF